MIVKSSFTMHYGIYKHLDFTFNDPLVFNVILQKCCHANDFLKRIFIVQMVGKMQVVKNIRFYLLFFIQPCTTRKSMAHEILQRRATFYLYLIKAFDPKQRSIRWTNMLDKDRETVLLYICIYIYIYNEQKKRYAYSQVRLKGKYHNTTNYELLNRYMQRLCVYIIKNTVACAEHFVVHTI